MTAKKTNGPTPKDTELVRELADILNETELAEIEIKRGDLKIRVSKQGGQVVQAVAAPVAAAPAVGVAAPTAASAPASDSADVSSHPGAVKSPMVGTAYTRPSPDADPFVKEGDSVKEGDTVLLVEAMKTFNPITATKSGTVTKLLVQDAQPVEYGEPLFVID